MRYMVFFLLCLISWQGASLEGSVFKEFLGKGRPGDYTVTLQGDLYTVLLIRSCTENTLILEEISIPEIQGKKRVSSWKAWVEGWALGHTSWSVHTIDLQEEKLEKSFSYSRRMNLYKNDPHNFFSKLLSLSLYETPISERKRVGLPPSNGEEDRRSLWMPKVMKEGKEVARPFVVPYKGKWPSDGSLLAGCEIELYFGESPFPYWIEVRSPHYRLSIRSIDSGSGLISPRKEDLFLDK